MKRLLVLLLVLACKQTVDPNKGHYSCTGSDDCGDGYECWPQFSGGGLCFPKGQCVTGEKCNAKDDNCDGRVDEGDPESGPSCSTGKPGPCDPGIKHCVDGALACVQSYTPVAELCNHIDDNCNGMTDEAFNLQIDRAHCGTCENACSSGAACKNAICYETNCSDGIDNDHDGGTDCADIACISLDCDGGWNCGQQAVFFDAGVLDDGGIPDAGYTDAGFEPACVAREAVCDDGVDDDLDGLTDCADPDCDGLTCATSMTCSNGTCQ